MLENQFYHIYNRGNNKEEIFLEEKNYIYFLDKFHYYLKDKLNVYAYCLMPNHFHFLIKVNEFSFKNEFPGSSKIRLSPIEKSFKDFFICYAKAINKAYNRTGSLFQYKFKRKIISSHEYLVRLVPYIHLNPVRAGLVNDVREWKYSSYNKFISNITQTNDLVIQKQDVFSWFEGINNFIEFHKLYNDFKKEREYLFNP